MPWIAARLRGQKVLAKVKADGSFESAGGRVEIRYRANDPRAYRAAAGNLERIEGEAILADGDVVSGEEVPKDGASTSPRARGAPGAKKEAAKQAIGPVPAGAWTVYADGACSGNPGPAGCGIYLVTPAGEELTGYEYLGTATNNIAELTAILRAAEIVPPNTPAVVHTDSQYSIGVLTKGWKAKANKELIASVKEALKPRTDWQIRYVPGHAGVPGNERADELAREAVSRRSTSLPGK